VLAQLVERSIRIAEAASSTLAHSTRNYLQFMKIIFRNLTTQEANVISQEIRGTKNITGYLPAELLRLGKMLVATKDKSIIGILYYKKYKKLIDLKILIVVSDWRGQGIGRKLFQQFMTEASNAEKIYTVTKSPELIHLVNEVGFKKVSWFGLPILAQLNELSKVFNVYRIKESLRKGMLRDENRFSYWVRHKNKPSHYQTTKLHKS
jgi:N-acetylglutamate synthase-like GNAT family acetyltransferase